jgi:hypothetical protein
MKEFETSKGFKIAQFDETLSVCDQLGKRGFYRFLTYDTTRGMNIGCSDVSAIDSLFNAIKYYQERLKKLEEKHSDLLKKVNEFVQQVTPEED